jgi:hypothetical protein
LGILSRDDYARAVTFFEKAAEIDRITLKRGIKQDFATECSVVITKR